MGISFVLILGVLGCSGPKIQSPSHGPEERALDYSGFGRESVTEEILERYAPPTAGGESFSLAQSLLDLRSPGFGIPSPDGQRLYFTWTVTGNRQVWRVDQPMGFPVQMTGGEDASFLQDVSPDGRWIVISRDRQGDEQFGIYLQSADGGPVREVFRRERVVASHEFFSDDSKYLYFRANAHRPDSFSIFRYNIENRLTEEVVRLTGFWSVLDHKADGRLLLREAKGNINNAVYEFDPETNDLTALLGKDEEESYFAKYSEAEGELLVLTNRFSDFHQLYRWKAGDFESITGERGVEISSFSITRDRSRVILSLNDRGYHRFEVYQLRPWTLMPLPEIENAEQIFRGSLSAGGRWLSLMLANSNRPSEVFVLDLEDLSFNKWLPSSSPEVDLSFAVQASLESYPARDGTPIPMFVWRPKICEVQLCPVIVDFHGGPEAQSIPSFSATALILQKRGFVFVQPNVRGSSGYGRAWIDADNQERRLNVITDIEDAAIFIRESWAKDGVSPKIGVMGGSYGGYSSLVAMSKFAGSYDAGVSIVGITSLLTFLQNTAPYRRALRISEYGDPETQAEILEQLSPINYRHQVKDPLLIIHGATDPRVPVGEALLMHDGVQEAGAESSLIIFADEGHGVRKRENQARMISYLVDFFETHLK